jgi:ABC-type Fe3+-citrate transport system substrate-binding protein
VSESASTSSLPDSDKITNQKVRQLVERMKLLESQTTTQRQTTQETAKKAVEAVKEKREAEAKLVEAQAQIADLEEKVKNCGKWSYFFNCISEEGQLKYCCS